MGRVSCSISGYSEYFSWSFEQYLEKKIKIPFIYSSRNNLVPKKGFGSVEKRYEKSPEIEILIAWISEGLFFKYQECMFLEGYFNWLLYCKYSILCIEDWSFAFKNCKIGRVSCSISGNREYFSWSFKQYFYFGKG